MRKLAHLLIRIPLYLITVIGSLLLSLFKLVCLLALVIAILFLYSQRSETTLATFLAQGFDQAQLFVKSRAAKDTLGVMTNLATDSHEVVTQSRWSSPEASVYIKTENPTFQSAYQDAIDQWNQTGAFYFKLVAEESRADIIAEEMSDAQEVAGLADTRVNTLTNYLMKAHVYLNGYYLLDERFSYSYERIVNTASHELGHAIGLGHEEQQDSVMQSSGSFYQIQDSDIKALKQLYSTQ